MAQLRKIVSAKANPPLDQRAGTRRSHGMGKRLLENEARHFGRSLKKIPEPACSTHF